MWWTFELRWTVSQYNCSTKEVRMISQDLMASLNDQVDEKWSKWSKVKKSIFLKTVSGSHLLILAKSLLATIKLTQFHFHWNCLFKLSSATTQFLFSLPIRKKYRKIEMKEICGYFRTNDNFKCRLPMITLYISSHGRLHSTYHRAS